MARINARRKPGWRAASRLLLFGACLSAAGLAAPTERTSPSEQPAPAAVASLPRIQDLIVRLESKDAQERKAARGVLLTLGTPVVEPLLERIEHADFLIRWEVVNLLGYLADERALLPLVVRAVLDVNPHVRWRALWALAVMHREETIADEFVRRMAVKSQRWNAAVGLSMLARPEAIPVLVEGLASEDAWIRFEAVFGLGRSFDARTSSLLLPLLRHPETRTRRDVVMSLGKIGDETAVRGLLAALADAEASVRWRAVLGLQLVGDRRAIVPLAELLKNERDETVLRMTRDALRSLNRDAPPVATREAQEAVAAPAVPRRAAEPGADERASAAPREEVLGSEVERLIRALDGSALERRRARQELLAAGPAVLPQVVENLQHMSFLVRWELVNLLGNLGDGRARDPLVDRILFDDNHHVRWRALWALAGLSVDGAADRILPYLGDPRREVRWRAAVAASMLDQQEAVPVLTEGLESSDAFVRWEAVNALARVHDERTTDALLPLLEDSDPKVRHEVVLCLGRIAEPEALASLVTLVEHADPQIRWRAAMALGLARHRAAGAALESRLERERVAQVRDHLVSALEKLSP